MLQERATDAMFVMVSDLHLDKPQVLINSPINNSLPVLIVIVDSSSIYGRSTFVLQPIADVRFNELQSPLLWMIATCIAALFLIRF